MQAIDYFQTQYVILRPGLKPMKWMRRMFLRLVEGRPPSLVDLPTGAAKTDLVVIWLIALAWHAKNRDTTKPVPRRLVWVVNRRVLVQQVYEVASMLEKVLSGVAGSAVELGHHLRSLCQPDSTSVFKIVQLRGQRLDDREWTLNPTVPQLIIGTVDQIGSRILFQGYGQSKWSRPMHAALLAVDSWVCVDEAHLVPAFVVTLRQVREKASRSVGTSVPDVISKFFTKLPFWVTELSATPGLPAPKHNDVFRLEDEDYVDEIISDRLLARKVRRVIWKPQPDKQRISGDLVTEALKVAKSRPGSVIAVFCCTAKHAETIANKLDAKYADRVLLVTGRIRGYERDRLERNPLFKRFREPHSETNDSHAPPTFLVGTAAAEVGLDADSSAIICDFASLLILIQRLGRLDRRGILSKRSTTSKGEIPTMTIIGGGSGKSTLSQLNALAKKLGSTDPKQIHEFNQEFFTGAAWNMVVGKEKSGDEEDEGGKTKAKQPHSLSEDDIVQFENLKSKILESQDGVSAWVRFQLGVTMVNGISESDTPEQLLAGLNLIIGSTAFYDVERFANVELRSNTVKLRDTSPTKNGLRKLNRWLLEDAFPNEISTGAKFGKEDAINSATWRVLQLPSTVPEEDGDDSNTQEAHPSESKNENPELGRHGLREAIYETRQPAFWLVDPLASVTAGPVVVPPLTDVVLQRWAATTPRPSRFLPVHPWLYGLLPDEEGTPLVGIAFRLELDCFNSKTTNEEDEDETVYDREWRRVSQCLETCPPLNSELHFVPLDQMRDWLRETTIQNSLGAIAHFDGDEWTNSIDPNDLSAKSVLVLPTSTNPELLKDIIPPSGNEDISQRCWDVFEALAKNGAKYRREIKIIAGANLLNAGMATETGVYRVIESTIEGEGSSDSSSELQEEENTITQNVEMTGWKVTGIKLSFSMRGINFELRYLKPARSSGTALDLLSDHLASAAEHGRRLAEALAPGDSTLGTILGHSGQQHDLGKDDPKWQQAMGNTPSWREKNGHEDSICIAKSVMENAGSSGGYRHEWGTLWGIANDTSPIVPNLDVQTAAFLRDCHLHVIAAHHGYFRPSIPDRGLRYKPTVTKQNPLRIECIERAARLQRQLGYWRLAYLETLIKVADVSASRITQAEDNEDEQ